MLGINPFSALTAKIFGGSTVLLALALALTLAWGKAGWRNAKSYETALTMQQAAMEAAQAAAQARAMAAKISAENESAELARKADNAEDQVSDLRAAAVRFADARGVRTEAPRCEPGAAPSPAPIDPAPDRDGPGADAVVLTKPEYDAFVANSLRLEQVRLWGESLIRADRAIPAVEFGQPEKP